MDIFGSFNLKNLYEDFTGISKKKREKREKRKISRIKYLEKQKVDDILSYIAGKLDNREARDFLRTFEEEKEIGGLESFGISKETSDDEKFHASSRKTLGEYRNEIFANLHLDKDTKEEIEKCRFPIKDIDPDKLYTVIDILGSYKRDVLCKIEPGSFKKISKSNLDLLKGIDVRDLDGNESKLLGVPRKDLENLNKQELNEKDLEYLESLELFYLGSDFYHFIQNYGVSVLSRLNTDELKVICRIPIEIIKSCGELNIDLSDEDYILELGKNGFFSFETGYIQHGEPNTKYGRKEDWTKYNYLDYFRVLGINSKLSIEKLKFLTSNYSSYKLKENDIQYYIDNSIDDIKLKLVSS